MIRTPKHTAPATNDGPPPLSRDGSLGLGALTAQEWLLTNGLGGYAMGTASGVPTRRYHGLLVATLSPPVDRVLALHSLVDAITMVRAGGEETVELSSFRFRGGVIHPRGHELLTRFEKGPDWCRWAWRLGGDGGTVTKTLTLAEGANAARVHYEVRSPYATRLVVRPLVALRDHHHLTRAWQGFGEFGVEPGADRVRVRRGERAALDLACDTGRFGGDAQWWYDFEYDHERDRGFDFIEDLYSPGAFTAELRPGEPSGLTLTATADAGGGDGPPWPRGESARSRRVSAMLACVLEKTDAPSGERAAVARLAQAADQFVVRRGPIAASPARAGVSVIAGYPWFADWGRDTLIALPGLLLGTGRHEEAGRVLLTFAAQRRRGLIPNRFNDRTGEAEFNTVDASLWFLRAACLYAQESGDGSAFMKGGVIRDACEEIIEAYRGGTDFGIGMDEADGLITAGDENSQLTWMDAKRDGTVFTPRHGKAVEINALWHHGLLAVAGLIERDDPARARRHRALGERVAASFGAAFWDRERGCCFDVLHPDGRGGWTPARELRPNQVFAASLEHAPLTSEQKRGVVAAVRTRLVTPMGLRTLDPADAAYKPRYAGAMRERDAAYHNGTVWPWLLGPFAEAVMRADRFSPASRTEARRLLRPLMDGPDGESLGQLPEVFDGDETPDHPRRPGGCPAQAWSVAETLRVWMLAARV
ncbi:MAG: amylo-alpha-1,6-glucosidase [Phycisphaerales bacterium]